MSCTPAEYRRVEQARKRLLGISEQLRNIETSCRDVISDRASYVNDVAYDTRTRLDILLRDAKLLD